MNKLKNIGISALAGTLVTLSAAQAGGVSVSGSYELSYTQLDHTKVSGNKLGVNKNLTFGASGDVSDGGGVTWATTVAMNDGFSGLSSASLSLNMGGIATLTYDSGTGGTGANAVDNIMPTAWEEVDYGFKTGISDVGAVSASKGVVNLTVKAPVAGSGVSLSYASGMSAGHISDGAVAGADGNKGLDLVIDFVDYDAAHVGFRWGIAAQVELPEFTCDSIKKNRMKSKTGATVSSCNGPKHEPYAGTMYTKFQLGPLHFGTQATYKNDGNSADTAIADTRTVQGGVAAIFGNTLSLSYGVAYDKYKYNDANRNTPTQTQGVPSRDHAGGGWDAYEYVTHKFQGFSAALNLGPVALKGTRNHVYSQDGHVNDIYANGVSHSEINLSIAF